MKIAAQILKDDLPKLEGELRRKVSLAIEATAIEVEQGVKGAGPLAAYAAPYRTGNLRRSYYHRRLGDLVFIVSNAVSPGEGTSFAPYAIFVEFGTRRMAARPHLRPAAEAARPRLIRRIENALAGF